jgi:hypothetical protein
VEKGFGYIAELGRVVIPYGIEVAKVFADPDKGFFISLAGYYALSMVSVKAEDVANQIESWAVAIENWDPVGAYESWVRSVTGLGDRPVFYLFNPMVAWEEVSAIEALREASCGWFDWSCYLSNAAKWVLKGILTPVFFIKNLLLGIAYYVIAGVVALAKFIAVGFLRYVLKPIAYAVVWVLDRVRESLKTVFCYYMRLAQVGTLFKEVVHGRGTIGRRVLRGIGKMVGLYLLASVVARECTLVPVEITPMLTPPTAEALVPTVPAVGYTGYATLFLYVEERLTYAPPLSGTATVSLVATESATATPPAGIASGEATVSLSASESASTTVPPPGNVVVVVDASLQLSVATPEPVVVDTSLQPTAETG